MQTTIQHKNQVLRVDLSKPIDISIPITNTDKNSIAWYIEKPVIEPVVSGEWIGSVQKGASTNFNNIQFNPHGHGTHTECVGHITRHFYSINKCLQQFFFTAKLITIQPEQINKDFVISRIQVEQALNGSIPEAIVIRTLPNTLDKTSRKYSNTNPPFLSDAAARFICESGIQHLLIDLPSVDKEKDDGKLLAHKAFWNVNNTNHLNIEARINATITEMIFVDNKILDGDYLLNIQIASFENDASPSKPILYALIEV